MGPEIEAFQITKDKCANVQIYKLRRSWRAWVISSNLSFLLLEWCDLNLVALLELYDLNLAASNRRLGICYF